MDESAPYVADLVRFWRSGSWGEEGAADYREDSPGLTSPALGVYSTTDRFMAPVQDGEAWLRSVSAGEPEIWQARAGEYGLKCDLDHMGLGCDPAARPLWERIETWLARATTS